MDEKKNERGLLKRVFISLLWLIPIVIVGHMLVGGIVGGIAGSGTGDFNEGYGSGQQASLLFFAKYGNYVHGIEVLIWLVLSYFGILPGTSKYKKGK